MGVDLFRDHGFCGHHFQDSCPPMFEGVPDSWPYEQRKGSLVLETPKGLSRIGGTSGDFPAVSLESNPAIPSRGLL